MRRTERNLLRDEVRNEELFPSNHPLFPRKLPGHPSDKIPLILLSTFFLLYKYYFFRAASLFGTMEDKSGDSKTDSDAEVDLMKYIK